MRVVAGRFGGRRIATVQGDATRPTTDRVREALFSILGPLDGARVLDLFAGSGALAIEALSRGAAHATLVEKDAWAAAVIERNLETLDLEPEEAQLLRMPADRALRAARERGDAYDLVFLDPPYRQAPALGQQLAADLAAVLAPRRSRRHRERPPRSAGPAAPATRRTPLRRHADPDPHNLMTPSNRIAVCPGSYDPITRGHIDVIERAAEMYDEVVVAVVNASIRKDKSLFDIEERLAFIADATSHLPNVRPEPFDTLVVDFAQKIGAKAIVKGLRAISDFEYEFEMNQLNRLQAPNIESLYLMASPQYSFLSSSGIKELATFGGNIDEHVTPLVARRLKEQLAR